MNDPHPPALPFRAALAPMHRERSATPIVGADDAGRFPDAQLLFAGPRPLVTDANWLRDDVIHSVRRGRHSAMVSLANAGVVRLYCASHVVDEVEEHYEEDWLKGTGVSPEAFWSCWTERYLPHLRVVDAPLALLSDDEQKRVATLAKVDPDDVPSVALALVLSAPFLSTDKRATAAVYGERIARQRSDLRDLMFATGDYSGAHDIIRSGVMVPELAVRGLTELLRWAWNKSSWLTALALLASAYGGTYLSPDARQRLGEGALKVAEVLQPMAEEFSELRRMALSFEPPQPAGRTMLADLDARAVLARAVIRTMSRMKASHVSAAEVADALDHLGVAQSEPIVRGVLRQLSTCFREIGRGRWQLGHRHNLVERGL